MKVSLPLIVQRGRRPVHAFSGPRSRGGARGAGQFLRQHRRGAAAWGATANGAGDRMPKPPALSPHRHATKSATVTSPCAPPTVVAGWRWCLRAQAPFAVASRVLWHLGVQATALNPPRLHPASVGRRTQVPPLPCCTRLCRFFSQQEQRARGAKPWAR